jgi:hypothetical protein
VVSPDDWLVSINLFLISTGLVAIGRWGKSASSCRVVRALVFTRWLCVALQLQLCLVNSSPSKVVQFSFEYCPLSHKVSSEIHHLLIFGRLACRPTPTLSLCTFPDLCWGLEDSLRSWLVTPTLVLSLYCFTCIHSLRAQHWEFSSLPHPHSPTSAVSVRLYFAVYTFQFCWGGLVCPGAALDYVPRGWIGELVWWSPVHFADSCKQLWN